MHLLKRDAIATVLVAMAGVLYALWAVDSTLPAMSGTRVTGTAILVLGFAASATAVVPNFDQLIRGNRTYLVGMSVIGLGAFAAAVHMLLTAGAVSLAIVMAAMVVMWLIATVHHSVLANTMRGPSDRAHRSRWHGQPHGAH